MLKQIKEVWRDSKLEKKLFILFVGLIAVPLVILASSFLFILILKILLLIIQ